MLHIFWNDSWQLTSKIDLAQFTKGFKIYLLWCFEARFGFRWIRSGISWWRWCSFNCCCWSWCMMSSRFFLISGCCPIKIGNPIFRKKISHSFLFCFISIWNSIQYDKEVVFVFRNLKNCVIREIIFSLENSNSNKTSYLGYHLSDCNWKIKMQICDFKHRKVKYYKLHYICIVLQKRSFP